MKENIINILNKYLEIYPSEQERLTYFYKYLESHTDEEITDWNNFEGHIVTSGFVYAKKENKFLVIFHKDLQTYLYPGGHVEPKDPNIFSSATREVFEETGIDNLKLNKISDNEQVPLDIDIHTIPVNNRLNLPAHHHFDFRYLFIIDSIINITLDESEISNYKWISLQEFSKILNCDIVINKLNILMN